jgi:Replication-relaxation
VGGGGAELRLWLNETATTEWLLDRVPTALSLTDVPHPDGLGIWTEHGLQATFMLEYDTGSEHLPQLTAKLPGYTRLAKAMADLDHICPLLLFCFPTPRREQAARRALESCSGAPALRIATAAIDPQQTSPAGAVWLPLRSAHAGGQVALSALGTALPDPWRHYRAEQERAREQAAQRCEPAGWDEDDGGDGTWRDE